MAHCAALLIKRNERENEEENISCQQRVVDTIKKLNHLCVFHFLFFSVELRVPRLTVSRRSDVYARSNSTRNNCVIRMRAGIRVTWTGQENLLQQWHLDTRRHSILWYNY